MRLRKEKIDKDFISLNRKSEAIMMSNMKMKNLIEDHHRQLSEF